MKPSAEQQHWYDLGYGQAFADKNMWRVLMNKVLGHFMGRTDGPENLVAEIETALKNKETQ